MIKVHIDTKTRIFKIEMAGIGPQIYAEVGLLLDHYYKNILLENKDEEFAKRKLERLLKTVTMTDEETSLAIKSIDPQTHQIIREIIEKMMEG